MTQKTGCCFRLTTTGRIHQNVGQSHGGELQIGQAKHKFCIQNNTIVDDLGRNCSAAEPDGQLHCQKDSKPAKGFFMSTDNILSFDGSSRFFACASDDVGDYNIFARSPKGVKNCEPVTLESHNPKCAGSGQKAGLAPASHSTPVHAAHPVTTSSSPPSHTKAPPDRIPSKSPSPAKLAIITPKSSPVVAHPGSTLSKATKSTPLPPSPKSGSTLIPHTAVGSLSGTPSKRPGKTEAPGIVAASPAPKPLTSKKAHHWWQDWL